MTTPAERWTKAYYANQQCRKGWDCAAGWDAEERAAGYLTLVKKHQAIYEAKIAALSLTKDTKILDIGSGPGGFAISAAKITGSVTAVEPAAGMRNLLLRRCAEENIENIVCIAKRWENTTIEDLDPPYDLVLASFSLGMADIRSALLKMHQVCSGNVICYWPAASSAWERLLTHLTRELYGEKYTGAAKAPLLLEILAEERIPATLEVTIPEHDETFSSFSDAVEAAAKRLNTENRADREKIARHLENVLIEKDGIWHLSGIIPPIGKITWKGGWKEENQLHQTRGKIV